MAEPTCTSYDCGKPATHFAVVLFGSGNTVCLYQCADCMKEFSGRQDEPVWRPINGEV